MGGDKDFPEGWVGPQKKNIRSDIYHNDQVEERNPMGYVPNKGASGTAIPFCFYSSGVILQPEEYCNEKMAKQLTGIIVQEYHNQDVGGKVVRKNFPFVSITCHFVPKGYGFYVPYRQGFSLCYIYLIYVWG